MRAFAGWIVAALLAIILIAGAILYASRKVDQALNPSPETVVSASLQGLREQSRLSTFVARYVAVVTSTQRRFGLSASKTLIMPGTVRYEVDLGRLREKDLRWDAVGKTLFITLPPVELVGPEVDMTQLREYDGGGLLLAVTDAEKLLDAANRRSGQAELLRQARAPVPMGLARDATRRAVERSFSLPLRAVGLSANVRVRFPDEPGFRQQSAEDWDRSRALGDVYGNGAK